MRLLEFAQLANNTLGTVDTARNLLTVPQGNGSVSALSQQINAVGGVLTSEIRGVGAAIQQDVRTVNSMVAQAQAQQVVLRQEIQQVLAGVTGLNALMKKHMSAVEDQFRFIVEEPVQNACYQLTAHLTTKEGVVASDEEIRTWLRILQMWISKNFSDMKKTMVMSSEDAVQLLSQSPDNIWFIASRMRLLFGNLIPDKFLLLPPVSIKFYFTVIKLYLNGLEKNPHLLGPDKAASISQEIQNTLNTYLEFSKFLKDNPKIVQAIFDRYENHVNKNTHQSASANELRLLLKIIVPMIEIKLFTEQLESLEKTQRAPLTKSADIWDQLPNTLSPNERAKKMVALLSQENAPKAAQTKFMLLPEGAAYTPIPSQINWASYAAPDGSSTSYWGCSYFPNQPKPPVFISVSILFLLLVAGYADTNFFRNSTLKKHVGNLIASCPSYTYSRTLERSGDEVLTPEHNWAYIRERGPRHPSFMCGTNNVLEYVITESGTRLYLVSVANHIRYNPGRYDQPYHSTPSVYSGHRANIFEYHSKLTDVLPTEYEALLNNSQPNDLAKYNILFKYYALYSQGQIAEADAFIRQQTFTQDYEKSYMLFLVAIVGRWDIFEAFNKIHPVTNYNWVLRSSSLTPSILAKQYGHRDVTAGLAAKLFPNTSLQSTGAADTSDYGKALEAIRSSVSTTKTKLAQYVPPPAQQVVTAAQAAVPLPDELTDDEMEEDLNKYTRQFFTEAHMHAGKNTFWSKPAERRYHRMGFRVIENIHFKDDGQRRDLSRALQSKMFTVSRAEELDNKLLVKLGPKTPKA